jgi:hypothetical protein
MSKRNAILIVLVVLLYQFTFSQKKVENAESSNVIGLSATYAFQIPGGDLAKRFGWNSSIGVAALYKLKSNWIFGVDASYLFGSNLKDEATSIFDDITTSDGHIIDKYGQFSAVILSERGLYVGGKFGKVIPLSQKNLNSGLLLTFGVGFLQHKINIENDGNVTPQIIGDYEKGYDKLTNGITIQQFVGYMYVGESMLANFYVGFEFTQGFTKSRRDYDFNLMKKDDSNRLDLLYSFRIGWVIPFYQRKAKAFYYN